MTPKEKAIDLYYKYTSYAPLHKDNKECALIAINEIEKEIYTYYERFDYWKEVKQEIEKL